MGTRKIPVGKVFTIVRAGVVHTFRREQDDTSAPFPSERIRVTHLACSADPMFRPYTFGTEPEWFTERNLVALGAR